MRRGPSPQDKARLRPRDPDKSSCVLANKPLNLVSLAGNQAQGLLGSHRAPGAETPGISDPFTSGSDNQPSV